MDHILEAPFHAGEHAAHRLAGSLTPRAAVRDVMPEQHRLFFAGLRYLPVATLRPDGTPVATVLNGPAGFVSTPDAVTLRIAADATALGLHPGAPVGLLGIDLATRRRNRANGVVAGVDAGGFTVAVQESFGNCPRYIHVRDVPDFPALGTATRAALNEDDRALIARADTLFVASTAYGRVDMSHRGGPAGFVRIENDTLVIPDYQGNRYFNTLGNLLIDPRATLLFVDFAGNRLLHVTGSATIDWEAAERVWRLRMTDVIG